MKRETKIENIKRIIKLYGSVTSVDLELESSPCIMSSGNKTNVSHLIEIFSEDDVEVVSYVNETIVYEGTLEYEELSDELIEEIHNIMENYEVDSEKTLKRCED